MRPEDIAALAAIRTAYAEPILYTRGNGLPLAIDAIPSIGGAAPAFQGAGDTLRSSSFEIEIAALPFKPAKGDVIGHLGVTWVVLERTELSDIASWQLRVEQ